MHRINKITDTVASFLGKIPGLESEPVTPKQEGDNPSSAEQKIDWDKLTTPGRIYRIQDVKVEHAEIKDSKHNNGFNFYVLGCADNGVKAQKSVAELMNKIVETDKKPDLIIFLGDNFTSHGVGTCNHDIFNSNFHDIYQAPELKFINGIPCVVIIGNHDSDVPNIDFAKINAQVQHSYYEKTEIDKLKFDPEKIKLFLPDKDDAKEVTVDYVQWQKQKNKWNMPSRYYGLNCAGNKELFFIDSNTYVKEYVEYYLKENSNKTINKQPAWLESVAKNPDTLKLLFLHHSLHTVGKRSLCSDAGDYLSAEDLAALQKIGISGNYNEILRQVLQRQGLQFDAVFAAHDHSMYYHLDKDKKLCQVVAGGAGGPLQNRFNYENNERTPTFIKDNGFVKVEITAGDKPELIFDFYGVNGHHLKFSNTKGIPIKNTREEKLAILSDLVITACDEYQTHLAKNPQLPWTFANKVYDVVYDDVINVDDLKNYFNRVEATDFETSVKYLRAALLKCSSVKYFPKWQEVFNKLLKNYNTSYDKFIASTEGNFERPKTPPADTLIDKNRSTEMKENNESAAQKPAESWGGSRFFGLLGGPAVVTTPIKAENKSPIKQKKVENTINAIAAATEDDDGRVQSKPIPIPKKPPEVKETKGATLTTPILVSESPPVVTKYNSPNTSFSALVSRMAESYFTENSATAPTSGAQEEKASAVLKL